jgi:hypothetical protein
MTITWEGGAFCRQILSVSEDTRTSTRERPLTAVSRCDEPISPSAPTYAGTMQRIPVFGQRGGRESSSALLTAEGLSPVPRPRWPEKVRPRRKNPVGIVAALRVGERGPDRTVVSLPLKT